MGFLVKIRQLKTLTETAFLVTCYLLSPINTTAAAVAQGAELVKGSRVGVD